MDVARTAESVMGLEDREVTNNSQEANMRKKLEYFQNTYGLAAFYRLRKGKKIISPKKNYRLLKIFSHVF